MRNKPTDYNLFEIYEQNYISLKKLTVSLTALNMKCVYIIEHAKVSFKVLEFTKYTAVIEIQFPNWYDSIHTNIMISSIKVRLYHDAKMASVELDFRTYPPQKQFTEKLNLNLFLREYLILCSHKGKLSFTC